MNTRQKKAEERKQQGLCTGCGKEPAKAGCSLGQLCIDKRSAVSTARYYKNKAAGVCRSCGEDAGGRSRCPACEEKFKTARALAYEKRKAAGLCIFCDQKAVTETLCVDCREKHRLYSQERNDELRQAVLTAYGPECAKCGEDDESLLQVDHKNGGGNEHRREIGQSNLYLWLRQNGFPKGFQILCASCNWKKR